MCDFHTDTYFFSVGGGEKKQKSMIILIATFHITQKSGKSVVTNDEENSFQNY